jgi:hypothetical protein
MMTTKNTKPPLLSPRSGSLAAGLAIVWFLSAAVPGRAQVSPSEIVSPELKAAEAQYFPQLKQLNQSIARIKFPFSFFLSRYVGLDPAKQAETDSRGLEFVKFHDRIVLKVTGNYNAAYNAERVTQNERASRTFHEVIVPIMGLVKEQFPQDAACDAIGFEISYHSRTGTRNYDYEGKEILVAVFEKADAFAFSQAVDDSARQEILNRSEVYLNGAAYGLSLSGTDPLNVEGLDRPSSHKVSEHPAAQATPHATSEHQINSSLLFGIRTPSPAATPASDTSPAAQTASIKLEPASDSAAVPVPAAMTQADADKLQAQYQSELDALGKEGAAKFHFVDYAPPSFIVFQNRIALQMTLRNSGQFDPEKTSIYKRAARSFDLFLAPQLKDLLEKVPPKAEFSAFDLTIVNPLAAGPHPSSEAMEFVIPQKVLRKFVDAEITNQQAVDQSIVLVNGVRIALNLQLVE